MSHEDEDLLVLAQQFHGARAIDASVLHLIQQNDGRVANNGRIGDEQGAEQEEEKVRVDAIGLAPEFSSQVVEALIHTAMEIGAQGYEGHPVGTILVVGDATAVMEKSRQLTLNPFQGMSETDRNCLDPAIRDAVKTFAVLDGAFGFRVFSGLRLFVIHGTV